MEDRHIRLEEEVRRRTETLRRANEELTAANEELRRLDKEKAEFLSAIAHDLRNPLASIRAYADMMLMFKDEPPETREEFLTIIIQESDRLSKLVNNLQNMGYK
jgi:signal transduction histidine kinase